MSQEKNSPHTALSAAVFEIWDQVLTLQGLLNHLNDEVKQGLCAINEALESGEKLATHWETKLRADKQLALSLISGSADELRERVINDQVYNAKHFELQIKNILQLQLESVSKQKNNWFFCIIIGAVLGISSVFVAGGFLFMHKLGWI